MTDQENGIITAAVSTVAEMVVTVLFFSCVAWPVAKSHLPLPVKALLLLLASAGIYEVNYFYTGGGSDSNVDLAACGVVLLLILRYLFKKEAGPSQPVLVPPDSQENKRNPA